MSRKLVILSAPSGAGKTTIVHHLLKHFPQLGFSVSATSREKRSHEIDGKDYYFLGENEFKQKIESIEFAEWEEVYRNTFYGTLKSEIDRKLNEGFSVIFDVDVKGGLSLKKLYAENALAIFVKPPSVEVLEQRLRTRKTESEDKINQRIAKATAELAFEPQFDYVLFNDGLQHALDEAVGVVGSFLSK